MKTVGTMGNPQKPRLVHDKDSVESVITGDERSYAICAIRSELSML